MYQVVVFFFWYPSVDDPSRAFNEFMDGIAQRIPLHGWTAYIGGLDVEGKNINN